MAEKTHRFSVDVGAEVHDALLDAAVHDGCGKTVRTRLLLELWARDEELQQRVREEVVASRARQRARH